MKILVTAPNGKTQTVQLRKGCTIEGAEKTLKLLQSVGGTMAVIVEK